MSIELLVQAKASLYGHQIDEALALFRQYNDFHLSDGLCPDINEIQLLLDAQIDAIDGLEAYLETIAYTWDEVSPDDDIDAAITLVNTILLHISRLYQDIATISSKYRDTLCFNNDECYESDEEAIADHFLNWAIAAKRAGLIDDCVRAHMSRMEEVSELVQTDAVRLLGMQAGYEGNDNVSIMEINKTGLFDTEIVTRDADDGCGSYLAHIPSKHAVELGKQTANIFAHANYTLENCTDILQHAISRNNERSVNPKRIYSANSFFNHRREAISIYDELRYTDESLKVLVYLFLFGISLKEALVEAALGAQSVKILFESGILTRNPVDNTMVLGEVQVYPLSTDTFDNLTCQRSDPFFIMTDWCLESLRLPKHAIMSIGYDSLELVALTAGIDVFKPNSINSSVRVLDLCCGCGVQWLFSAKRSISWTDLDIRCELYAMDINPRACRFVCANACLNGLVSEANTIYSIEADLYQPLHHAEKAGDLQPGRFVGNVDIILSNPPFVAVPVANTPSLDPALYAVGGGHDGMHLVKEILNKCFTFLSEGSVHPQLLMVTEFPNVETSCNLLHAFLDASAGVRINVAYIEDDVEVMEDYAREREEEAGQQVAGRNWNPTSESCIKNRALVLISISKDDNCDTVNHGLFCFKEKTSNSPSCDNTDEEDQFLTAKGIAYARKHLL